MEDRSDKWHIAPPLTISAVGLIWCWFSWRRWPDILIDYGRELYVPWRLSQGNNLYSEVSWIYGPLSPYFNAWLFKLFGTSFSVLFIFNLLLTALMTVFLYRLFRQWTSRLVVTAVCLTFISLFGLAHLQPIGNYNFISPYSHSLTHGIWLSLAAILSWGCYLRCRKLGWLILCHLLVGLVFLCKLEAFVAIAGALTVGWILLLWKSGLPHSQSARPLLAGLACVALPTILAILMLSTQMTLSASCQGVFFSWTSLIETDVTSASFHKSIMGIDRTGRNLIQIAGLSLVGVIGFLVLLGLGGWAHRRQRRNQIVAVVAGALIAILALSMMKETWWFHLLRPLPVAILIILLGLLVKIRRCVVLQPDTTSQPLSEQIAKPPNPVPGEIEPGSALSKNILLMTFATFALLLMLKILLRVNIYGYGFALAMPATLIVVLALLDWLPRWVNKKLPGAMVFSAVIWTAFSSVFLWHVKTSALYYANKTACFAREADMIRIDPHSSRNECLLEAVEYINTSFQTEDRFAVLPEGAMLNYATRRPSSIPYYNFDPSILAIFREERILSAFEQHPPRYLVLCSRETSELGGRFFGIDYGLKLMEWIKLNYEQIWETGTWPPQTDSFGIVIMRHSDGLGIPHPS